MTEDTIKNVINSANTLFIHQGYKVTQISQIAKMSNIATGSMYHLFENKTALFQFVLRYDLNDIDLSETTFPIPAIAEPDLLKELTESFLIRLSTFTAKMHGEYSFHTMLSDAFDLISKNASSSLIFEHNMTDCKELSQAYLKYRLVFFQSMTEYLDYFDQKGLLKPIKNKTLAVRFIIESLAFWAMHLPYGNIDANNNVPIADAKEVAVETLCSAYLRDYEPSPDSKS